jgi:hypothetical protein
MKYMDTTILLKWLIRPIVCALVLISISISIVGICNPKNESIPIGSLLVPDSTRFVSIAKIDTRVRFLSEIVLQHESSSGQDQMAHQSERMQTHLSYIGLFAVLFISFLPSKHLIARSAIVLTATVFFLSFYFYDIHTVDLNLRQRYGKGCIDTTVFILSRINLTDSTWYNIDYQRITVRDDSMHTRSFSRKLGNSIRPDLSQVSFYFVPFTVILVLYLFYPISKDKRRNRRRLTSRSS